MLAGSPCVLLLPLALHRRRRLHSSPTPRRPGEASRAAAHGMTAYPIVSFDKSDLSTLESFNSLDGRAGGNACARGSGRCAPVFFASLRCTLCYREQVTRRVVLAGYYCRLYWRRCAQPWPLGKYARLR